MKIDVQRDKRIGALRVLIKHPHDIRMIERSGLSWIATYTLCSVKLSSLLSFETKYRSRCVLGVM